MLCTHCYKALFRHSLQLRVKSIYGFGQPCSATAQQTTSGPTSILYSTICVPFAVTDSWSWSWFGPGPGPGPGLSSSPGTSYGSSSVLGPGPGPGHVHGRDAGNCSADLHMTARWQH